MLDFLIRCSALGQIMKEPQSVEQHLRTPEIEAIIRKTKRTDEEKALLAIAKEQSLSDGGKTAVRRLVKQELFGVDFVVDSKEMAKGRQCEQLAIGLLNRVRGLALVKNTERRSDGLITGECDLFDAPRRRGHDLKVPWWIPSFPLTDEDAGDVDYWWQMQGYMRPTMWDALEWEVNYVLLDTPEELIRYEPKELHQVSHVPEHLRLTTWLVKRDDEAQRLIGVKVAAAREYAKKVIAEYDRTHPIFVPQQLEAAIEATA